MPPFLLTHAVDLVGAVLLVELLLALRRPVWLPRLAAGLGFWLALRLSLSGVEPEAIASALAVAGVAHAIDRWRDARAARPPVSATPFSAHGPQGPERLS